jgi:trehalose 6-phosphate synthase
MVSNRVAGVQEGKGATGGLSVAVTEALAEEGGLWFGWNGKFEAGNRAAVSLSESGRIQLATMPLSRRDYDDYYRGYANGTLWPLLHTWISYVDNSHANYTGYRRVNALFAGRLMPLLAPDDTIWVHDYHLIPLALELRRLGFEGRIGFFLHVPLPPPDVLKACSRHADLVHALCTYDLVGFQTEGDVTNLRDYITREGGGRLLSGDRIEAFGRTIRVAAFPIGVYPDALAALARESYGEAHTRRLVRSLNGRSLMIGVDRLDYSKGLDNRLKAFESLLERYPDNRGHVTFLQIAPPSRSDVATYREIRATLEGLTGHINGRFAEYDWVPLRYLNKSFRREQLTGFFRAARVGVVTPLRDGMNLVAKEYVAAQDSEEPGALVLSEFAGAARELSAAVLVNPYDIEHVADGLQRALNMPVEERRERWGDMMAVLRRNDLGVWRRGFVAALKGGDT